MVNFKFKQVDDITYNKEQANNFSFGGSSASSFTSLNNNRIIFEDFKVSYDKKLEPKVRTRKSKDESSVVEDKPKRTMNPITSEALVFGEIAHCYFLQRDIFNSKYTIVEDDLVTSPMKLLNENKVLSRIVNKMVEIEKENRLLFNILNDFDIREVGYIGKDWESELPFSLRYKCDLASYCPVTKKFSIADLKFLKDDKAYQTSLNKYTQQLLFYANCIAFNFDKPIETFELYIACVNKTTHTSTFELVKQIPFRNEMRTSIEKMINYVYNEVPNGK